MKRLFTIAGGALAVCMSVNLFAQTAGTLTFSFTPVAHSPCYEGTESVMAIWIQTNVGAFVKTKLRNVGGVTSDHLPTWAVNSGGTAGNCLSASCNITDATTGATLQSFTAKSITWDGKNVSGTSNGTIVADGVYKVTIQETWNHGTGSTVTKSYTFTKGPTADHQTPANDANFTSIKLDWVPATAGIASINPLSGFNIYPNPVRIDSYGADVSFTIEGNASNAEKIHYSIYNIIGMEIKTGDIATNGGIFNEKMNVNDFSKGMYFIAISDGKNTSTKKLNVQ